jgi:hypothetical protein
MGVALTCPKCGKQVNSDEPEDLTKVVCPACENVYDGVHQLPPADRPSLPLGASQAVKTATSVRTPAKPEPPPAKTENKKAEPAKE